MSPRKPKFFNWPPFKLYAIDADTGKPLDPNVGMKTHVTYYDIKKDSHGRNSIVAHKSPASTVVGSKVGAAGRDEQKLDDAGEKKCDCRKKADGNKTAESKGVDDGKVKATEKKDDGKAGGNPKDDDKKPDEKPWTTEEDAKLKELKAENKSWRDIAQEMGRPQFQLKARFKEIKDLPAIPEENDVTNKNNQKSDNKRNTENRQSLTKDNKKKERTANKGDSPRKHSTKHEEEKKPTPPPKPASTKVGMPARPAPAYRAPSVRSGRTARFALGEWLTLQEDDLFSFGELQLISELIARDRNQTWLRISSAFFDKTGRKVHPYDIRDKFFQLESMG